MNIKSAKWSIPLFLLPFVGLVIWYILPKDEIDFNTQVKPILNNKCIACHGGVKQSGGFSLLFENEAKGNTDSGTPAIIPGFPNKSEMIRRIQSHDPEVRMPYQKEPLDKKDIKILKQWIDQGAKWDQHWAYIPVKNPEVSNQLMNDNEFQSWGNNDIDYFIYEKLKEHGLKSSSQTDWPTLARRLSLDLTGLPPSLPSVEKLNSNTSENAIALYIEELLASPHYGEKWAGMWMDLARYADTKGYEKDGDRTIWKYRDWIIKAFNEDMPYGQFITEQIAGDLLPKPTDDQLIATAFHRNTMTNDEGGSDNEEFRVAAVIDRINTTWEATMGTTFSCVQCHSHPFDPFKQEEYYKFMAFFNNTRDEDTWEDYPSLRTFNEEDKAKLNDLSNWLGENAMQVQTEKIIKFVKTWQPSFNSMVCDEYINSELVGTARLFFRNNASSRLKSVKLVENNTLIYRHQSYLPGGIWEIHTDSIDGPLLKRIQVADTKDQWTFGRVNFQHLNGIYDLYFTYSNPNLKDPKEKGILFDWFYFMEEFPGKGAPGFEKAKANFWHLLNAESTKTPIILENPAFMKRETRIFERGNWLSQSDTVSPGVPEIMNSFPENAPANRLGISQWLVSPQNPLTARTYVNRIWEQLFGYGIVATLEDLGSQGIPPTHQKLLDHLAWKFMYDFNWSTKALLEYVVSSATYQQSSFSTPEHLFTDPQNRYYARGPRIRLSAEQIRDQALAISGLLSPKLYGPSVMPYQPEGIWNSPYNGRKWKKSDGEDQYRRAIYTYWKRTGPYPSMLLFDVMAREVCTSRRINTNTPLQALVTLNDSVYVEASFHFAKRMIEEGGNLPADQIKHGYKLMMYKDISDEKLSILLNLYNSMIGNDELIKPVSYKVSQNEIHYNAMTIVANTMLNLDEFIVKN